jgi:chromatin segregation and condensation protein Rec8/ScpA/Scc1 (kleisin family)
MFRGDRLAMKSPATPPPTLADQLDAIAERVNRNTPARSDPERFHAEKSDIEAAIKRISKTLRFEPAVRRSGTTTWRPPYAV